MQRWDLGGARGHEAFFANETRENSSSLRQRCEDTSVGYIYATHIGSGAISGTQSPEAEWHNRTHPCTQGHTPRPTRSRAAVYTLLHPCATGHAPWGGIPMRHTALLSASLTATELSCAILIYLLAPGSAPRASRGRVFYFVFDARTSHDGDARRRSYYL